MNAKEFAKLFGGFSTERRVVIISALLEAGKAGMSLIDLSRKTELSVIDIGIAAEALLLMGLIDISIKGENKMLYVNRDLLDNLFTDAYNELGPGRAKLAAAAAAAAAAAEAEAAAAEAEAAAAAAAEAAVKEAPALTDESGSK